MRGAARKFRRHVLVLCTCAFICVLDASAARTIPSQDPQQPDSYSSNSGVPAEPAKSTPTAANRAVTQKIRKAIAADKSLSAEGRRVKVTAQGGKVTLQGAARSESERTSIFTKAADVAGEQTSSTTLQFLRNSSRPPPSVVLIRQNQEGRNLLVHVTPGTASVRRSLGWPLRCW